jgi:hypothetical protein
MSTSNAKSVASSQNVSYQTNTEEVSVKSMEETKSDSTIRDEEQKVAEPETPMLDVRVRASSIKDKVRAVEQIEE